MRKILLIKTGHSETFADSDMVTPSLGDVLRSTVLLPLFALDHVTWLSSVEALPILENVPKVGAIFSEEKIPELIEQHFDMVVNLERGSRFINFFQQVKAKEKFGFTNISGERLLGGKRKFEPLTLAHDSSWQSGLFQMVNRKWNGEEYQFQPRTMLPEKFDIGINWVVGKKWPSKSWPKERWNSLAERLSLSHSISWQEGFDSLETYISWVASCRQLITTDSLGLHLALAMKKKVFSLFGPTAAANVYFYGRGHHLSPGSEFSCSPCFRSQCTLEHSCMDALSIDRVYKAFMEQQ